MPHVSFEQTGHLEGNAPDTTPDEFRFNPPALVIDIMIFTNDALVSYTSDGVRWSTERRLPAGFAGSFDQLVRGLRIRNRVVLSVATFDITLFGNPVEVTGRELQVVKD